MRKQRIQIRWCCLKYDYFKKKAGLKVRLVVLLILLTYSDIRFLIFLMLSVAAEETELVSR